MKFLKLPFLEQKNEIEASKTKNIQLKYKLGEHEEEEKSVILDQQIILLQNLIEEKKIRFGNQAGHVEALQESLNVCSANPWNLLLLVPTPGHLLFLVPP